MTTPAQLPGLSSDHAFFAPVDEHFERDLSRVLRNAERGSVESATVWPMGPYNVLEMARERRGGLLSNDQAMSNPGMNWGQSMHAGVVWRDVQRGFRAYEELAQDMVQVPNDVFRGDSDGISTRTVVIGLIAAGALGILLMSGSR